MKKYDLLANPKMVKNGKYRCEVNDVTRTEEERREYFAYIDKIDGAIKAIGYGIISLGAMYLLTHILAAMV